MANAAKQYLQQAYFLQRDIESKQQQLEVLRSISERATGTYEALRISGTDNHSKMESAIIKMQTLEQRIAASTEVLAIRYAEIAAVIEAVEEPTYRALLAYRYLGFKKWEEIAVLMNYSWRNIHYLHNKALGEVCIVLHTKNLVLL